MSHSGMSQGSVGGTRQRLIIGAYLTFFLAYSLLVIWFVLSPVTSDVRSNLKSLVFIGGVALVPLGAVARHHLRVRRSTTRTFAVVGILAVVAVLVGAASLPGLLGG